MLLKGGIALMEVNELLFKFKVDLVNNQITGADALKKGVGSSFFVFFFKIRGPPSFNLKKFRLKGE